MAYKDIAAALGIGTTTVYRWLNPDKAEDDRERARQWKERNRGECVDCGASTNASSGTPSERCLPCSAAHRRYWTREAVVAALQEFARIHGRQPRARDFSTRRGPDDPWPHLNAIYGESGMFDSWADALTAAGFQPFDHATEHVWGPGKPIHGERAA